MENDWKLFLRLVQKYMDSFEDRKVWLSLDVTKGIELVEGKREATENDACESNTISEELFTEKN